MPPNFGDYGMAGRHPHAREMRWHRRCPEHARRPKRLTWRTLPAWVRWWFAP